MSDSQNDTMSDEIPTVSKRSSRRTRLIAIAVIALIVIAVLAVIGGNVAGLRSGTCCRIG